MVPERALLFPSMVLLDLVRGRQCGHGLSFRPRESSDMQVMLRSSRFLVSKTTALAKNMLMVQTYRRKLTDNRLFVSGHMLKTDLDGWPEVPITRVHSPECRPHTQKWSRPRNSRPPHSSCCTRRGNETTREGSKYRETSTKGGPGGRHGVPTENARGGPAKHSIQPGNAKAESVVSAEADDVLENKRQLRATNGQVGTWAPQSTAYGHRHRSRQEKNRSDPRERGQDPRETRNDRRKTG